MEESRRAKMAGGRVPSAARSISCPSGVCETLPKNVGAIERAASVMLGAAGILCGIKHGGTSGLLLAGLGAAGVYRGLTGHCYGYDALGIDTTEHPDATVIDANHGAKSSDLRSLDRVLQDGERSNPISTDPSAS